MYNKVIFAACLVVLIVALIGVLVWLAQPPVMPAAQMAEQSIPDDRIPR